MSSTLLLVDDEHEVLAALRRVFRKEDYRVLSAGNGEEALTILREQHVDVLLTDHLMTGMTGIQLLQNTRRMAPTVSRILLSGYVDEKAILTASNEGDVQRFLYKPWEEDELRAVVREFIDEREVRERKEYLESLIESCPDPIVVSDLKGNVCFVNQPAVAFLGEPRATILGRPVSSWFPRGEIEFAELAERIKKLGRLDEFETEMRVSRGLIPVSLSIAPWRGASGRIQGYIGTAKDISERKRAENDLLRTNLDLSAIKMIAKTVISPLELDRVLPRTLDAIREVNDAPMGAIFLCDEGSEEMLCRVTQGIGEEFARTLRVPPAAIQQKLAVDRDVLVMEDVRTLDDEFGPLCAREGILAAAYIPILWKDRLAGLVVIAYDAPREIDPARRRLLLAIGGIVGTAVENASLFERTQAQAKRLEIAHREAQQRAEDLTALHHHSQALAHAVDLPGLLDSTAKALIFALRAQAAGVLFRGLGQLDHAVYMPEGIPSARQETLREEFAGIVRARMGDLPDFVDQEPVRSSGVRAGPEESTGDDLILLLPGEEAPEGLLWARRLVSEPFSAQEEELARTISNQAASTLRRIRDAITIERRQIEALVEGMIEPVIMLDENLVLVSMNAAARRLLELGPKAPFDPFRLAPHTLARAFGRVAESRGEVVQEEISFEHPSPRVYDVRLSPVSDPTGRRIGTVALFQDITSRREVEQMKTEFVANVSHELRTPLTSIKESISLLLDGVAGEVTESQKECLCIAHEEVNRLVRLINDVLEISRIEATRLHLDRSLVSIRALAEEVLKTLRVRAERSQIHMTLEAPARLPRIYADPDRITQILLNLLDNALKFTPPGGSITLRLEDGTGCLSVRVSDTGRGIPAGELDRVFDKFHQVRSPRESGVGGTGLGLSIVKALVEMHGGTISAESSPGHGSEFVFTLAKVDEARSLRASIEGRIARARREEQGVGILRLSLTPKFESGNVSVLRRQVIEVIRRRIYKSGDKIFFRGNATFIILLDEVDPEGVGAVRDRLDRALRADLVQPLEGWTLQWGCAVYPEDGTTVTELLRGAGVLDETPEELEDRDVDAGT